MFLRISKFRFSDPDGNLSVKMPKRTALWSDAVSIKFTCQVFHPHIHLEEVFSRKVCEVHTLGNRADGIRWSRLALRQVFLGKPASAGSIIAGQWVMEPALDDGVSSGAAHVTDYLSAR